MLFAEEIALLTKRGDDRSAVHLTPAQDRAANQIIESLRFGDAVLFRAETGMGRTAILRHVHNAMGGAFVGARHFVDALMLRRPDAIEQAFVEMLEDVLDRHETVVVDDLHLVTAITTNYEYKRQGLLDACLEAVLSTARGRKIVFGTDESLAPQAVWNRASVVKLAEFAPEDYRTLAGEDFTAVDFTQVHRTAPSLNAYQLRRAFVRLGGGREVSTERFIGDLNRHHLTSNVELSEVQAVTLKDLKGMDDVIAALEAKIALPFENPVLAAELQLKAKRGVLLAGPPGPERRRSGGRWRIG